MMNSQLQIVATGVWYYHEHDERAFFEWLDRMTCVSADYYGVGTDLFINLNRRPTDEDIHELIGFFRRYGIDMSQLAKFETDENRAWLRDPEMSWCNEIFGDQSGPDVR